MDTYDTHNPKNPINEREIEENEIEIHGISEAFHEYDRGRMTKSEFMEFMTQDNEQAMKFRTLCLVQERLSAWEKIETTEFLKETFQESNELPKARKMVEMLKLKIKNILS